MAKGPRRKTGRGNELAVVDGGTIKISEQAIERMSSEQEQALFVQSVLNVERMLEQVRQIKDRLKEHYAMAKTMGFEKKEIDYAVKLRAADEKTSVQLFRRQIILAQFVNHAIGFQAELLGPADEPSVQERAARAGRFAGLSDEICKSPYTGENEQIWINEWHNGQAERSRQGLKPIVVEPLEPKTAARNDDVPDIDEEDDLPHNDPGPPCDVERHDVIDPQTGEIESFPVPPVLLDAGEMPPFLRRAPPAHGP